MLLKVEFCPDGDCIDGQMVDCSSWCIDLLTTDLATVQHFQGHKFSEAPLWELSKNIHGRTEQEIAQDISDLIDETTETT